MKTIFGDLLTIPLGIICHQTNCRGVAGGLAGALNGKYPKQFEIYFRECARMGDKLAGTAIIGSAARQPFIAHIFGQIQPGPCTDMELVRPALEELAELVSDHQGLAGLPIYAPYKMGCGLGGGDWPSYLGALVEAFPEIIIVQRTGDI